MKHKFNNSMLSIIVIFLVTGCSSSNSFEECQKLKTIDNNSNFELIYGQIEYKKSLISYYANFKDKELKEIIKIMLIENDLDATTVQRSIAVYCQQIGYEYYK
jgi:hypothetical protein